jgi:hypothetical protein
MFAGCRLDNAADDDVDGMNDSGNWHGIVGLVSQT